MLLEGSRLTDLGEVEATITSLLRETEGLDENARAACARFEIVVFDCEGFERKGGVVTFEGVAWWLEGGKDCERFRLDAALDTDPLLYSFEFSSGRTGAQTLYAANTPRGWQIEEAGSAR